LGTVARLIDAIVPDAVQRLDARLVWGVAYPVLFAAFLAVAVALAGGPGALRRDDWLLLLLVSAGWWATWSLLATLVLRGARERAAEVAARRRGPER
jgi:hypothetical protein